MFDRFVQLICASSVKHPLRWLLLSLLVSVPAVYQVTKIRLNTDLTRLLPKNSRAVYWSQELSPLVGGDGGYFSMIFEGDDPQKLQSAVQAAAERCAQLPEIQSVDYRNPLDFLQRFRYLLLPSESLRRIFDTVVRWKSEAMPLGLQLEQAAAPGAAQTEDEKRVATSFQRYANLSEFHRSQDGRLYGMIVRPRKGITNLSSSQNLFSKMEEIAEATAREHGVWAGVGGSLRNKIDEFRQITSDLTRCGTIAAVGILVTLLAIFRSLLVLPAVLYPLAIGLLWSYSLVPWLVGDLNTITSFLLMVLLGMGVEWSIHLVKRFQAEIGTHTISGALLETFRSTGASVLTSGFTTATGLVVLALSDFRGFSEYGIISASSMLMVFLAMFTVLPATLVMGARLGLIRANRPLTEGLSLVPPPWATAMAGLLIVVSVVLCARRLGFDYDFSGLSAEIQSAKEIRQKHREVYSGFSAPAAIYVARDLPTLDRLVEQLRSMPAEAGGSTIGSISSVRDFLPMPEEEQKRRSTLSELQESLQGRWTRRVKDEEKRRWIEDIRTFAAPESAPTLEELPESIKRGFITRDGSGQYLLMLDTPGRSKDGQVAMQFTSALYQTKPPEGVLGPTGDKLVLAEILELVTGEAPWLVGMTLLGILILVMIDRAGNVIATFWILLPLICGIVLTLGTAVALGWKLNFFNMLVLPSLIGMSVDSGVHYYRRWEELGCSTNAAQQELFEPLTGSAITTGMGYAGMVFAHHQGLRSIGNLAVLGIACCWFASVFLMPGILRLRENAMRRQAMTPAAAESGD